MYEQSKKARPLGGLGFASFILLFAACSSQPAQSTSFGALAGLSDVGSAPTDPLDEDPGPTEGDPNAQPRPSTSGGRSPAPGSTASTKPKPKPPAQGGPSAEDLAICMPIAAPVTAPKVPFRIEYTPRNNNLPIPLVGGDPTGTWRVTTAQIYVPESQRRNIDNDSRGEVTGWLKFEGNVVHGSVAGVMNLQTRIGDTPVNVDFDGGARVLRQDPTMVMDWPCQNVDGGLPRETISYSVLTDRGYFVYKRTNTLGDFYIVLTATRV